MGKRERGGRDSGRVRERCKKLSQYQRKVKWCHDWTSATCLPPHLRTRQTVQIQPTKVCSRLFDQNKRGYKYRPITKSIQKFPFLENVQEKVLLSTRDKYCFVVVVLHRSKAGVAANQWAGMSSSILLVVLGWKWSLITCTVGSFLQSAADSVFSVIAAWASQRTWARAAAASDSCWICVCSHKTRRFWWRSSMEVHVSLSVAPRCVVYYIESRYSPRKHCFFKVFNWRLCFKTASSAAGFILIAGSNALNEASAEECG